MLRFAAAVLAVAAITPTPAEEGLARLSEALASPAVVNNDVLWTRCGALDKMAPHSTMQLHSHSVKCQDGQTGATASDRRSRFDRAESVAAAGTADAAVVNHCFIQISAVHFKHSGVPEYATIFDPSRPCSLLSDDRALHTGDSWPPEAGSGDLPPPVVGATGAGHVCVPRGSAFAGSSYLLHRGPSLSPTVHRPALRGASRWFLPRSACPNNSAWARMVTGPTSSASTDVHWD